MLSSIATDTSSDGDDDDAAATMTPAKIVSVRCSCLARRLHSIFEDG